MITEGNIKELEVFFEGLIRPLPNDLEIYPGLRIKDPETFIKAQMIILRMKPEADYSSVVYTRLLLWKNKYLKLKG